MSDDPADAGTTSEAGAVAPAVDPWDTSTPAAAPFFDLATGELIDVDPTSLAGLAQILASQQVTLFDQARQLSELQATAGAGVLAPADPDGDSPATSASRKWCWRTMDPSRTETLWRDLADWVGWLRSRYPLAQTVPGCWWAHPELVEELTALYRAWLGAVAGGTGGTYTSIEWHDRWLPGTLTRIRGWGADRCAVTRHHQPKPDDSYTSDGVDDPALFDAHVAADLAARRGTAPTEQL